MSNDSIVFAEDLSTICAFHSYYDADKAHYATGKYHGTEDTYVDNVKLCGTLNNQTQRRACITFRVPVSTKYFSQRYDNILT